MYTETLWAMRLSIKGQTHIHTLSFRTILVDKPDSYIWNMHTSMGKTCKFYNESTQIASSEDQNKNLLAVMYHVS